VLMEAEQVFTDTARELIRRRECKQLVVIAPFGRATDRRMLGARQDRQGLTKTGLGEARTDQQLIKGSAK